MASDSERGVVEGISMADVVESIPAVVPATASEVVEEAPVVEKAAKSEKGKKMKVTKEKKVKEVTVKEPKATKAKAPKAPKPPASHPTYMLMVVEAIGALKERTGSSQYAIAKYLEDKYKKGLAPNFKKMLTIQLRNLTKGGKLVKVKNSFKLSDELKKPAKVAKATSAPKSLVKVAPKAKTVKIPAGRRVKTKSAGEGVAKSKAPSTKGAKETKSESKVTKVAKPKPGSKVGTAASKKAVAKTAVSAKKAAGATKKAAVHAKKSATVAVAKKPVTGRKPPTVRKMTTPKKAPKSVKSVGAGVKVKAAKPVGRPAKKVKK